MCNEHIFYLKKKVSRRQSIYILYLIVLDESTNFKTCDAITDITSYYKLQLRLFLKSTGSIKMKFGQISAQLKTKVSYSFWHILQKQETNCRLFYEFDKVAILCDLLIFSRWGLLFLIMSVLNIKRVKNCKIITFGFWLIVVRGS